MNLNPEHEVGIPSRFTWLCDSEGFAIVNAGDSGESAETWHYQRICDKTLLPDPPAGRKWEFTGFYHDMAAWFAAPIPNYRG